MLRSVCVGWYSIVAFSQCYCKEQGAIRKFEVHIVSTFGKGVPAYLRTQQVGELLRAGFLASLKLPLLMEWFEPLCQLCVIFTLSLNAWVKWWEFVPSENVTATPAQLNDSCRHSELFGYESVPEQAWWLCCKEIKPDTVWLFTRNHSPSCIFLLSGWGYLHSCLNEKP